LSRKGKGAVVTEGDSGTLALEELTPEQRERLRAAVRILIDYLLEQASLNSEEDETQAEVDNVIPPEPQPVPSRLES
jgi:hypothetical protein